MHAANSFTVQPLSVSPAVIAGVRLRYFLGHCFPLRLSSFTEDNAANSQAANGIVQSIRRKSPGLPEYSSYSGLCFSVFNRESPLSYRIL